MQKIHQLLSPNKKSLKMTSNQPNKSIVNKLSQYWFLFLWIISAVFSFGIVVLWIVIALVWPINDNTRLTQTTIVNTRVLEINYPKRLVADKEAIPIYLTIDQGKPFTLSIGLSNSEAAIVTTGIPTTTAKLAEGRNGYIDITWPDTRSSVANLNLAPDTIPETFHAIGQPRTVTLFLKDILSGTKQDGFFYSVQLFITLPDNPRAFNNDIFIELETPLRASFRSFTEKYYFIAALPFLLPLLGELWKRLAGRRYDRKLVEAQKELENYQKALASGELEATEKAYTELKKYLKTYFASEEQKRLENINDLCKGDTGGIKPELDFQEWPDMWCDALIIGGSKVLEADPKKAKEEASKAKIPQNDNNLRYYIRLFPTDILSNESNKRFIQFYKGLKLFSPDVFTWPSVSYAVNTENSVFFSDKADDFEEQRALFNISKGLFWPEHPVYKKILATDKSFFIRGDEGCGKTTFALALSRLPNPEPPKGDNYHNTILTSYHTHTPMLEDIQEKLGHQMLDFISQNPASLVYLLRTDRDLLSRVLLSIFDAQYVFSVLEESRYKATGEPAEEINLRQEILIREITLMWQSVKNMANGNPLLLNQWFMSLIHCAGKLKFSKIRIVLDLKAADWEFWHQEYFPGFRSVLALENVAGRSFIQLVVFTNATVEQQDIYGFQSDTLSWTQASDLAASAPNWLSAMAEHRFSQADPFVLSEIKQELINRANGTPRRLAQIWCKARHQNPGKDITGDMIIAAANTEEE